MAVLKLVVAGGFRALDSVEILDPSGNNVWTQGMFLKFITVVKLCFNKYIPVEFLLNKSHFIFQDQIYHWD